MYATRIRLSVLSLTLLGFASLAGSDVFTVVGDLSGVALRRSGLAAMRDVVTSLQIPARYVVFGHTHRGGPRPDDDVREWDLASGGSLVNSGSWVLESFAVGPGRGGPYWPGAAVELDADGVPRPVRLLDDLPAERLTPRH